MATAFLVYAENSGRQRIDNNQFAAEATVVLSFASVGAFALIPVAKDKQKRGLGRYSYVC